MCMNICVWSVLVEKGVRKGGGESLCCGLCVIVGNGVLCWCWEGRPGGVSLGRTCLMVSHIIVWTHIITQVRSGLGELDCL